MFKIEICHEYLKKVIKHFPHVDRIVTTYRLRNSCPFSSCALRPPCTSARWSRPPGADWWSRSVRPKSTARTFVWTRCERTASCPGTARKSTCGHTCRTYSTIYYIDVRCYYIICMRGGRKNPLIVNRHSSLLLLIDREKFEQYLFLFASPLASSIHIFSAFSVRRVCSWSGWTDFLRLETKKNKQTPVKTQNNGKRGEMYKLYGKSPNWQKKCPTAHLFESVYVSIVILYRETWTAAKSFIPNGLLYVYTYNVIITIYLRALPLIIE